MIFGLRRRLRARIAVLAPFTPLLVVVLFLFAVNIFMDAQALTSQQQAESELGDASSSITLFDAGFATGSRTGDDLRTLFDDEQKGYSLAVNSMDFPFYQSGLQGIYFSEKDWLASPPDAQFRLTAGTWPRQPGEVTIGGNNVRGIAVGDKLDAPGGGTQLIVVGVAQNKLSDLPIMMAAPKTWRSFTPTESSPGTQLTAFPTFESRSASAPQLVRRADEVLSSHQAGGVIALQGDALHQRLERSVRTQAQAKSETPRPWTVQSPLSLWVPGLILVPGSIALGYLILLRRLAPAARHIITQGVRTRVALASVWLVPVPMVIGIAAGAAVAGGALGWATASVGAGKWGYFVANFRLPTPAVVILAVGVAVSVPVTMLLIRMQVLGTAESAIRWASAPARRAVAFTRQIVAGTLGCLTFWKILTLDEPSDGMTLAGAGALVVALMAPELVRILLRFMPQRTLTQRLVARQMAFNQTRMAGAVGIYIVLIAATVGVLTVLSSQIQMLRDQRPTSVPAGQILVDNNSTLFKQPAPELMAAINSVPSLQRTKVVQFYMIGNRFEDPTSGVEDARNTVGTHELPGISYAFDSVEAVQMAYARGLTGLERSTLRGGGVLVPNPDRVTVKNGQITLVGNSTGLKVGKVRAIESVPEPSRWTDAVPFVTLRSTATKKGWSTEPAAALFPETSSQDARDVRQAVLRAGLNPKLLGIHQDPAPIVPAAALVGSAFALVALVLAISILATRAQVRSMRRWASHLTDIGVSTRWARRSISLQYLWIGALAVPTGAAVALTALGLTRLKLPDLVLEVPWTLIVAVLAISLSSTVAGAALATRNLSVRQVNTE